MASNAPVYTRRLFVGDCRPQTPVKPGATAPGFLSRLRRLLLPAGEEKTSSRVLLVVAIFLIIRHTHDSLHVVFGDEYKETSSYGISMSNTLFEIDRGRRKRYE